MKDSNKILTVEERTLKDKLFVIRGQQVMLDFDLAKIYGYTTKAFNQQVQRNIDRFPEDFLFRLTTEEVVNLRSQNVTSSWGGSRYPPFAFTEQGIYMLMTVLKGSLAVEQSKNLIRLFKSMKDYITENQQLMITRKDYFSLAAKVESHSRDISEVKDNMVTKADLSDFVKLFDQSVESKEILILDGEPFKADLAYQKIYRRAKESIIVIDDYISAKTLQHLIHAKAGVSLTIISDNKGKAMRLSEYLDFRTDYPNRNVTFLQAQKRAHDRYIILDNGTKEMRVYHCGASSKDAGKRITTITRILAIDEYKQTIKSLLSNPALILV